MSAEMRRCSTTAVSERTLCELGKMIETHFDSSLSTRSLSAVNTRRRDFGVKFTTISGAVNCHQCVSIHYWFGELFHFEAPFRREQTLEAALFALFLPKLPLSVLVLSFYACGGVIFSPIKLFAQAEVVWTLCECLFLITPPVINERISRHIREDSFRCAACRNVSPRLV